MDRLLAIAFSPWVWWPWAILFAFAIRLVVLRLAYARFGRAAYGLGYVVLFGLLVAAVTFVAWSGMQMYGFDREDPWQMAGGLVLSFVALPLLFGAPVVLVVDIARFWIARLRRIDP